MSMSMMKNLFLAAGITMSTLYTFSANGASPTMESMDCVESTPRTIVVPETSVRTRTVYEKREIVVPRTVRETTTTYRTFVEQPPKVVTTLENVCEPQVVVRQRTRWSVRRMPLVRNIKEVYKLKVK